MQDTLGTTIYGYDAVKLLTLLEGSGEKSLDGCHLRGTARLDGSTPAFLLLDELMTFSSLNRLCFILLLLVLPPSHLN